MRDEPAPPAIWRLLTVGADRPPPAFCPPSADADDVPTAPRAAGREESSGAGMCDRPPLPSRSHSAAEAPPSSEAEEGGIGVLVRACPNASLW